MGAKPGKTDSVLFILIISMMLYGMVVLYSMSAYNGRVRFSDSLFYVKKQVFAMLLGSVFMVGISKLDYHKLHRFALPLYGCSLALSGAVLLVGETYNGSRRWLSLGPISFQPSELAKPAVILLLAGTISKLDQKKEVRMMLLVLGMILPIVGLVGTNNLSTAVIILGIAVIMIFISNPRYLPFLWIICLGIGFLGIFLSLESYRLERLEIWRHPELYEKGYQTMQGLYAIGSGSLFGKGLGESIQKLGYVPEAQNDMIFAVICEEMGLGGAMLLIVLFVLILWRFMITAVYSPDLYGTLTAAGIMAHLALQLILNIAVVTNSIPNTGITLPFISYGGTSILFLLSEMGLGLAVSRFSCYPGKAKGTKQHIMKHRSSGGGNE